MKGLLTLLIFTFPLFSFTQGFLEICPNQNTTGTVVSFEEYNGAVYGTGFFNQICSQPTSYIAKYENGNWMPGDFSISDPGHALRQIDGLLYISRYEESIDSNWVLTYDGNTLEQLGAGVYLTSASGYSQLPNIYDIIKYDGNIIVCGEFDRAGSQVISGIMSWNGITWEDMGGGLFGSIANTAPVIFPHEMLVHNSELYVVGNFKNAGNVLVNGIAKWDGNEWAAMGSGFNNTVYGIGVFENEIYVGGAFTGSGGVSLDRIAKWDGTAWVSPGFGFTPKSNNDFIFVHTIEEIDNALFIAGGLKQIVFEDGTKEDCGGIISVANGMVNTYEGGVQGNDIEAVIKYGEDILIGGGVFGRGYLGVLETPNPVYDLKKEHQITVYPNPVNDVFYIESLESFDEILLLDTRGIAYSLNALSSTSFDVSLLPAGLFLLRLRRGEQWKTVKFLKL